MVNTELSIGETHTASTVDPSPILELQHVSKSFNDEVAVDEVSLTVTKGEFLTLLGPSGCGKTTTLRMIAGLERPDAGSITVDGEMVANGNTATPAEDRAIGIVFQDFALFPHLTAAENIAFGLSDLAPADRENRVQELLALVDLTEVADQRPEKLSGGQQQRIALARSLAPEPQVLLLDEPFSNLDIDLRVRMREEVRQIVKEAGVTTISVTHDQEEALSISDRIAIMNNGRIEQVGSPETVFQQPTSRFAAGFLGHASFLRGAVKGDIIDTCIGRIGRDQIHGLATEYDDTTIDVLVRPDDLIARPVNSTEEGNGIVTYRRYLGPNILYRIELESGEVVSCMHNHTNRIELDQPVDVALPATHQLAWFPRSEMLDAEHGS